MPQTFRLVSRICNWAVMLLFLSSCQKWLDKSPSSGIATPKTINDLQALLDEKNNMNEATTPSMPEASADNYFVLQSFFDTYSKNGAYIAPYIWGTDPFSRLNDWQSCYYPIYIANVCLEQISKIPKTGKNADQWNNVKGSALFFRAYYFLMLCWTYSKSYDEVSSAMDLGIVLRNTSNVNDPSIRANAEESYKSILEDAKEAMKLLPNVSIHCLRPSKAAAYGLLARTYLSMRKYDSSLTYANKALEIYSQLMDYNGDADIINSFSSSAYPFRKYNKEIIFYSGMNVYTPSHLPSNGRIDTLLYLKYDSDDLRKSAFFKRIGSYYSFKGNYTPEDGNLFSGIATDELYLTRAECFARVGGVDKNGDKNLALSDLNFMLEKRWKQGAFIPKTAPNAKTALDIILTERQKELLMRGLRWVDIKRLNKEGNNIQLKRVVRDQIYSLQPNENRYALPLPEEIVNQTGIIQNPR